MVQDKIAGSVLGSELQGAISRLDLALHLAWSDTRTRYRRSVLGPFWLVLGTLVGVGGLGFVWSTLSSVDRATFVPSLTISLVVWYLLSAAITESASVFYSNRNLILSIPISSLLVSVMLLCRQLINFAHNLIVVVLILLIYPEHLSLVAFAAIPGTVLVALNLLWVIQLVGYFGARFRDMAPLIAALMQPLFFLTPVLFRPEQLGARAFVVELNPLSYWLAIIRDPLMGEMPSLFTWSIVVAMTVVGWTAAILVTASKRRRLAYWVN